MGNDRVAGHPIYLITKIHLWLLKSPLVSIHIRYKCLHSLCPFRQDCDLDWLSPIFQSCSFQAPAYPSKSLATVYELVYTHSYLWPFLFQSKNEQACSLLKVLCNGKISLHHCPSGMSHKEVVVVEQSTFKCCMYIKQNHLDMHVYQAGPNFLFFSQMIVENSPWGNRYRLRERR